MSAVKSKIILPAIFVAVFACSRIPGLMPLNFSVAYAFAFCAGVYFRGSLAWWLPLGVMLATDIGLNFYYAAHGISVWDSSNLENLAFNYVAYAVLIFLGRRFKPQTSLIALLGGGLLGAILFYLITNTASWLFNPSTWEFFRNTLFSGGLFTALFAAAEKLTAESPAEKNAGAREPETKGETEAGPEEAKA